MLRLRLQYPEWGARKLQVLLAREGVMLTVSSVHRLLLRYEMVREQDRHSHATCRFERERPNELWQMDFKGPRLWPGTRAVRPLSVIDDHSRYAIWSLWLPPRQGRCTSTWSRRSLPAAFPKRC